MPKPQDIISYVKSTEATIKAAEARIKALESEQAKLSKSARSAAEIQTAIEKAADAIIAYDREGKYTAAHKPRVMEALRDPVKVLNHLAKVASERGDAPAAIGTVKAASDGRKNQIGGVSSEKKPSDLAFEKALAGFPSR